MKFYRIEKKDAGRYGVFDPFGWMQWMALPNAFAIGALDEAAGNTAGLMVGMAEEEVLTILWLAVDSAYQAKGFGEGLLRKAYELMEVGQIPRMRVVLDQAYEWEPFSKDRQSYFTERLFSEENPQAPHWVGTLFELSQMEYYKEPKNKKLKPVPLRELTGRQIAESLKDFIGTGEAKMLYDVSKAIEAADPEVSCILTIRDECCGGFFVQRLSEDMLLPVFIYAESDREADAMIRHAYDRAMALYGDAVNVSAVLWDVTPQGKPSQTEDILLKLARRALPKRKGGARILSVTRSEYNDFLRQYHP